MNLKSKVILLAIATISILMSSCEKQESLYTPEELKQKTKESELPSTKSLTLEYNDDSPIQLGRKLTNPYTVRNMQQAYNNLRNSGQIQSEISIDATHYYVRFMPADSLEYDDLRQDTSLNLFPYPLDYELVKGGASKTAQVPEELQIPEPLRKLAQYTAVPVDYKFPDIEYEILEHLFLPETLETRETTDLIDALDYEALRITDNLDTEDIRGRKWRPTGRITVSDDVVDGQIAVSGAKVRIRRFFSITNVYTNYSGYFSSNKKFRGKVNYMIVWETGKYDIRDGYIAQAYYNGPKKKGSWNLYIDSGKSLRFATIHRTAMRYHFLDIGGLKRPGVWTKLKICYRDQYGTGTNWGQNWQYFLAGTAGGIIPKIVIYGKNGNGGYRPTNSLFSTTIHELGHASHINLFTLDELQFMFVDKIIRESWAKALEWYITRIEYVIYLHQTSYDTPSMTAPFFRGDNMQTWRAAKFRTDFNSMTTDEIESNNSYTPIFIDLIDDYNQLTIQANNGPDDNVDDYTMDLIESFLRNVYNIRQLKGKLRDNKPGSVSYASIDIYMDYYFNIN